MTYSPALILHICGGIIAILAGSTALFVRKGDRLHRASGDVFVVSMLAMSASGGLIALMHSQRGNILAGMFTFYLVSTAWLTVTRPERKTGRAELGLLLLGLAAAAIGVVFALQKGEGSGAAIYIVFASVALLSVLGDMRMIIRGGVAGTQRLVRHLWRMCVALFIAAGSFFLGRAGDPVLRQTGLRARLFPDAVRKTGLPAVPVLIIVILTIFWLFRVKFSKAYRTSESEL